MTAWNSRRMTVRMLTMSALFAALTAVCSQIVIPIQPVPINLATLSVLLAAGVLGGKYGFLSQLCYVLLGIAGVPVFTMFRGGVSVLVGPTGGYIVGYLAAALLTGFLIDRFGVRIWNLIFSMTAGIAACYLLGTIWFVLISQSTISAALMTCVLPFLPGDAGKIAVACLTVPLLRKTVRIQRTVS